MANYSRALMDYDHAIKLAPDNANAYLNRASALVQLKRLDEARRDVARCRQLGGNPSQELVKALNQLEEK
jgi:Flp pilus assembly protein TadD